MKSCYHCSLFTFKPFIWLTSIVPIAHISCNIWQILRFNLMNATTLLFLLSVRRGIYGYFDLKKLRMCWSDALGLYSRPPREVFMVFQRALESTLISSLVGLLWNRILSAPLQHPCQFLEISAASTSAQYEIWLIFCYLWNLQLQKR